MASAQSNIMAFNSKLNEFLADGKYCDVNIRIDGKSFKCHRLVLSAASEYFDTMFSEHSRGKYFTLEEVDAEIFEEVVRYVYTGDVILTEGNVLGVLRASQFYKLLGVEELCCQFIQKHLPVLGMTEIFIYASLK